MPVKTYDRKTNTFRIIKPKLVHTGPIKRVTDNDNDNIKELTQNDKYRIYNFVNKVEYFGTEFGAKTILSTSNHDIFKIRDEVEKNKDKIDKMNIEKEKFKKPSSMDIIRKQLGLG